MDSVTVFLIVESNDYLFKVRETSIYVASLSPHASCRLVSHTGFVNALATSQIDQM